MIKFEVENHKPSYLPDGEWNLVWSDEFDGTELDASKWDIRLNFWGKPFDAYTDQGIILDGKGNVELHRTLKNGRYVSPQLQTRSNSFDIPFVKKDEGGLVGTAGTNDIWKLGELSEPKFSHRYGYYECRCKFQKYPKEMWSAFWLQSPSIGTTFDPAWSGIESDIMEYFEDGKITCGNIMGGYGPQLRHEGRVGEYLLEETEDGYHRIGLLWDPDGYVFYCDGKEISRASNAVSQIPQFILLTTEVVGYRRGLPDLVDEFIDDAFIVDYVRVFDRK